MMRSLGFFYDNYDAVSESQTDFINAYSDIFTLEIGRALRKMKVPFKYGVAYDVQNDSLVHAFILIEGDKIGVKEDIFLDARGINTHETGFWYRFYGPIPCDCDDWFDDPYNGLEYYATEAEYDNFVSSLHCKRLRFNASDVTDLRAKAKEMIAKNFYSYFFHIVSGK